MAAGEPWSSAASRIFPLPCFVAMSHHCLDLSLSFKLGNDHSFLFKTDFILLFLFKKSPIVLGEPLILYAIVSGPWGVDFFIPWMILVFLFMVLQK